MPAPPILRTKITPPRRSSRTLIRARLSQALADARFYRLTVLQAGAGYGKSTALAALGEAYSPLIWYQVTADDNDPLVFLLHLCHAAQLALPGLKGLPFPVLDSWDGTRGPLPTTTVVNQFLNALSEGLTSPTLLVLDDLHLIAETPEIAHILDRLIGLAPSDLHTICAVRPPLRLPNLAQWRARGQVLDLDQRLLLFTPEEIEALFAQNYEYELTGEEIQSLAQVTEGWAITLQLIWQSVRTGAASSVQEALARPADSLDSLFHILAQEVFGKQPEDVQDFMRISAVLKVMTAPACNALREAADSAALLSYLQRQELFIVDLGEGGYRYHHIFQRFLRRTVSAAQSRAWHGRAAAYYLGQQDLDAAVYHLLKAEDLLGAANLLSEYGNRLLATGRLDTLATYLDELPPATLQAYPNLLTYLGDLTRLHSRFQEALGWYQQAEAIWREQGHPEGIGRALRGQARIYLDTVNPSRAEEILQQALRLSDGTADREAQARLYELLAENKLNAGKPQEAEHLRQQAQALRQEGPHDSELLFRVLIRTGRLEEARTKLEARAQAERETPVQTPRAHRETQLLLAIIYAFQGRAEQAYQTAVEGTQRGVMLDSPFVIAVGHMRQGHGLMLLPGDGRYAEARAQFEKTNELSQSLAIPRLGIEANWGLCRAYGYQGDLAKAQELAHKGIEIATQYGDEWIASLIRLALGASFTLAARYESAADWLDRAARGLVECSDPFGLTAVKLWQCLAWYRQHDLDRVRQTLPEVLASCQDRQFDYLFTRPTLLGPPSARVLIPLLVLARDQGWEADYAKRLLKAIGLPAVTTHPGYQLRVITLGAFQTRRGAEVVTATGWRREKSRQLFQLLITYRHAPLDRDQILEYLWPGVAPLIASRNFKVALSTLYNVLEPERVAGSDSAYILREGKIYGIRPGADLYVDAEEFLTALDEADKRVGDNPGALPYLEKAVALYQGEYLLEARYEVWSAEEREHLSVRFLQAADQLSEIYLHLSHPEAVVELCQRILAQDNCWERAYRHLMLAYNMLGDHGQVARTYQRCIQTLHAELDVAPAQQTETLYNELTRGSHD
jgi:DNA-binding SARP family transcriptional activator